MDKQIISVEQLKELNFFPVSHKDENCSYQEWIMSKGLEGKTSLVVINEFVNDSFSNQIFEIIIEGKAQKLYVKSYDMLKTIVNMLFKRGKIYVAGKISGLDYEYVVKKFKKAGELLTRIYEGYEIIIPTNLAPQGTSWEQAMRICIREMVTCDIIALLPNWKDSEGAREEQRLARILGIKQININI